MKCLIVTAHPLKDSLCNRLTHYVEDKLVQLGHEVSLEDLYVENFEPALTKEERASYYQNNYESAKIDVQVERLRQAQSLILVFPTWWFGFPAILKGWFDRVWGPGIAYNHATDYGPIKPCLDNLREVLVITTLGSPWWVDHLIMRQPLKRITRLALLKTCAKHSQLRYLSLYKSEKLSEQKIKRFINKIEKELTALNS